MIAPLPGWSWDLLASGVVLRPRTGPALTEIRYVERLPPLAPVDVLVASAPPLRRFVEQARSPIEPFVTDEGEYAAQVTQKGSVGETAVVRTFAFVFFDDQVARLIGLARAEDGPGLIETVRRLAVADAHQLGLRRRRFVHAPPDPATWHGYLWPPFDAHWVPRTHPRDPTRLVVLPAFPRPVDEIARALIACGRSALPPRSGTLLATSGLSGPWYTETTASRSRDVILLADGSYVYPLVLESTAEHRVVHLPTVTSVAASVEPIPQPRGRPSRSVAGGHWAD